MPQPDFLAPAQSDNRQTGRGVGAASGHPPSFSPQRSLDIGPGFEGVNGIGRLQCFDVPRCCICLASNCG